MESMKIVSIANQKGGVGKSADGLALGAVLASDYERRVLLVDIDPQSVLQRLAMLEIPLAAA